MDLLLWLGIAACIVQSAIFSGLNLAVFSISRLRLEVEASGGNRDAQKVLLMRQHPNQILVTILWGNVGINVLLTLLSNSVLTGVSSFLFSTFAITLFGEIAPQAYFSRNALRMASVLSPVIRFYQFLLSPLVRPSAWVLDRWLGAETLSFFREEGLKEIIRRHMLSADTDLSQIEGIGALNFLTIDDLPIVSEGTPVLDAAVIEIDFIDGEPMFPEFTAVANDPFLRRLEASDANWVVIVDHDQEPHLVLDVNHFLRHALFGLDVSHPLDFCYKPVVIYDRNMPIGKALVALRFVAGVDDHIIENDILLVWGEERRLITGGDILGRLLRGISGR